MFKKALTRFLSDKRGNFPMMAVFAFPVMFGGVALSIDVMNGLRMRTELQNASDTAVLYATRFYQEKKAVPTTTQVQNFVKANFNGPLQNVTIGFDTSKSEMTLKAESPQKPYMMNYFGNHNSVVKAQSKATLGVSGILEFALALDTTESMKYDGRMDGLKVAARNFVNMLYDVKDRGADVKGSIVPFARYVNVGVSRRNEAWMDVPADIDERVSKRVCKSVRGPKIGTTNCRIETWEAGSSYDPGYAGWWSNNDGVQVWNPGKAPKTTTWAAGSKNVCDNVYGPDVQSCTDGPLITWYGCVGSRESPQNLKEGFNGNKFPGLMDTWCGSELQPLTTNRGTLISKINSLSPYDNTYIPEGVMWGTRMLTSDAPFTEAKEIDPTESAVTKDRKALIIMTDGDNTLSPSTDNNGRKYKMSPKSAWHEKGDVTLANQNTLAACAEAKSKGLEVYTIAFGTSVSPVVKALLASCASDPDFTFEASNAAALNLAFKDIADQLLSVRLSQ